MRNVRIKSKAEREKQLVALLVKTKNVQCKVCEYIQHERHEDCRYCGNKMRG